MSNFSIPDFSGGQQAILLAHSRLGKQPFLRGLTRIDGVGHEEIEHSSRADALADEDPPAGEEFALAQHLHNPAIGRRRIALVDHLRVGGLDELEHAEHPHADGTNLGIGLLDDLLHGLSVRSKDDLGVSKPDAVDVEELKTVATLERRFLLVVEPEAVVVADANGAFTEDHGVAVVAEEPAVLGQGRPVVLPGVEGEDAELGAGHQGGEEDELEGGHVVHHVLKSTLQRDLLVGGEYVHEGVDGTRLRVQGGEAVVEVVEHHAGGVLVRNWSSRNCPVLAALLVLEDAQLVTAGHELQEHLLVAGELAHVLLVGEDGVAGEVPHQRGVELVGLDGAVVELGVELLETRHPDDLGPVEAALVGDGEEGLFGCFAVAVSEVGPASLHALFELVEVRAFDLAPVVGVTGSGYGLFCVCHFVLVGGNY